MRKIEYATLARIIANNRRIAISSANSSDSRLADKMTGRIEAFEIVAKNFATSASVDKQAFLKACGIEP